MKEGVRHAHARLPPILTTLEAAPDLLVPLIREMPAARLKTLSENDWQRTARHGEYSHYSVFIMCRHIAMHDLLHGYRIEALVLAWE